MLSCGGSPPPSSSELSISRYDLAPDLDNPDIWEDSAVEWSWTLRLSNGTAITRWTDWSHDYPDTLDGVFAGETLSLAVSAHYQRTPATPERSLALSDKPEAKQPAIVLVPPIYLESVQFAASTDSIDICIGASGLVKPVWASRCVFKPGDTPDDTARGLLGLRSSIVDFRKAPFPDLFPADSANLPGSWFTSTSTRDSFVVERYALPRTDALPDTKEGCLHWVRIPTLSPQIGTIRIRCVWYDEEGNATRPALATLHGTSYLTEAP